MQKVPTSEERGLWRRGMLKDASSKASGVIKKRLINSEVAQIDRLR